ncbi:MAG: F0F1 ATP synthase subunit gamma [Rhizobiales bacterium]|nr:F0F1 ATP synthase subunit gamma [Hyphomicrobiales bacterium]
MPSLKDLRNRIASVKATQKITKAMQMVAAAKLRRAQLAAEEARPYAERMDVVMANLATALAGQDGAPPLMVGTGKDDVHLLVACSSERGLCGGFNTSIVRMVRAQARALLADGKQVKILCVGKKGFDQLNREFASLIIDQVDLREVKRLAFSDAQGIGAKVLELFDESEFDVCTLFFARFQTVMTQIPTALQLIPAAPSGDDEEEAASGSGSAYEYEPDESEILVDLLPRNVSVQIFRALLENAASEQGARMSAMDSATRNAGEMIDSLTMQYNRSRQAQITKELIEIISGAEAL